MAVPISNVTRRVVYAASGTGPYAFTFEILANTDIAVYEDDTLLTLTTDYSVTIAANGTGSITLVSSPTGTQIAIVGNRTIQRTTDFVTGGDFFANTVNDELDQQTIFAQQNAEGLQRALQAPQTDPTSIDMTLPRASIRASKVLSFDASGNPSATEFIGSNRGNWASGTLYYVRDIIKDTSTSNIWQCVTEHTSSGSQPIASNADAAKWFLLVDAAAAGTAQAAAEAAQAAAETAQTAAETAETNAASSASSASTSASNASTSATNAAASASSASTSATNASNSASTASTQASNASTSATNAASSASAASTSATNASNSATSASTSASNASTSETNAASSESAASASESAASTSATNAANSATAAAGSATNAAASAAAAAASFDAFDDIYLGAKSSDPSVDNDGDALSVGDQYFNSVANELRVWNGSSWQAASVIGGTVSNLTVTNTITADGLTLGDNEKAIFGAGSDLQIYHDGANSYIVDAGTGGLYLNAASQLRMQSFAGEDYIICQNNADVRLFYDNAEKLATTSTGIDVTGTATMDGLTVDGTLASPALIRVNNAGGSWVPGDEIGRLQFYTTDPSGIGEREVASIRAVNNSSSTTPAGTLEFWRSANNENAVQALEINQNGDIKFFEDTGTTAQFTFDASTGAIIVGGENTTSAHGLDATTGSLFLRSTTNNANIGLSLYVNEGANNRRASFFVDDSLGVYGVESTATSGVPDFVIRRAGGEVARFTADGLTFNGDTAAANALDDYEEGTFTPVIQDSSGNSGTVTSAYGHYVKIGRTCTIWLNVNNITTTGLTASNDLRVTNLPFAAVNVTGAIYMMGSGSVTLCSSTYELSPTIIDNTQYVVFLERVPNDVNDFILVSEITSGTSDLWATVTYYTTA